MDKNKTVHTYETDFHPKFIFGSCKTIEDCIKAADAQTQELRQLQAIGFRLDPECDTDHPRFITEDLKVAKLAAKAKFRVEYWVGDEDEPRIVKP